MPVDVTLLAEVPLFALLDEQERAVLAQQLDEVTFAAGHLVFNVNDPGGAMYVIRSGEAEVFFKNDTGERIVLEVSSVGDFFGELSLLDNGPRTAAVVVTKDMDALRVDRNDLSALFKAHPGAAMDLLTAMGRRMRKTVELLRHTATRNVNEEVEDKRTIIQKSADWIAEFSGSIPFLGIHIVAFTIWIVLNTVPGLAHFDPFPFGFLTMCVSLEAIILSVFVLLSQNRQAAKDRVRSDIEYDVNLIAELEIAHLHEKLDHLHAELNARLEEMRRVVKNQS